MKLSELRDIIVEETAGNVQPAAAQAICAALTKNKVLDGRKDLTPMEAGWAAYAILGCPNSNYNAALMWVKDRQWEFKQFNPNEADWPPFALGAYLGLPELIEAKKVNYFAIGSDGRLIIFRWGAADVLPKKLSAFDPAHPNKTIDAREKAAVKATLIEAQVIANIARRLGFRFPGAKEVIKIYADEQA